MKYMFKKFTCGKYIYCFVGFVLRIDRVLSFFSSRPNWDPPPFIRRRVLHPPPPFGSGGAHSIAGEGMGGPSSDEETDTVNFVVLCVYHRY